MNFYMMFNRLICLLLVLSASGCLTEGRISSGSMTVLVNRGSEFSTSLGLTKDLDAFATARGFIRQPPNAYNAKVLNRPDAGKWFLYSWSYNKENADVGLGISYGPSNVRILIDLDGSYRKKNQVIIDRFLNDFTRELRRKYKASIVINTNDV